MKSLWKTLLGYVGYYLTHRYECRSKALIFLSHLETYSHFPWICYKASTFKIKGYQTRKVIEVLKFGDVVLRGYDNYLDSYLIPGDYTHAGIYVGKGKVIHATDTGVSEIDIIDFLRCDRCSVYRPKSGTTRAYNRLKKWLGAPYDFFFKDGQDAFYCFELVCEAYKDLNPNKETPVLYGKTLSFIEPKYLASSIQKNPSFKEIIKF